MNRRPLVECLSPTERQAVCNALRAAVEGDFFPEWEFSILIGATREEVRGILSSWPHQPVDDEVFSSAIMGVLGNLVGYPHGREDELARYVAGGKTELKRIILKLNSFGYVVFG